MPVKRRRDEAQVIADQAAGQLIIAEQVIGGLTDGFGSINTATQQTYSVALTPAPWRATSSSIFCSTAIQI